MTLSLYSATVPSYIQLLGAVDGLLQKAEAYCIEKGVAPSDLIQARLAADMFPFAYQVKSTVVHSLGAIQGVRKGVFSPDFSAPPDTFLALRSRVTEAVVALAELTASEVDAWTLRPITSCCHFRSQISTSMRPLPTTSSDGRVSP
jgi:uncharacterized protein